MSAGTNQIGAVPELVVCLLLVLLGVLAVTNWRKYVERVVRDIVYDDPFVSLWFRGGLGFFGLVGVYGVYDAFARLLS